MSAIPTLPGVEPTTALGWRQARSDFMRSCGIDWTPVEFPKTTKKGRRTKVRGKWRVTLNGSYIGEITKVGYYHARGPNGNVDGPAAPTSLHDAVEWLVLLAIQKEYGLR